MKTSVETSRPSYVETLIDVRGHRLDFHIISDKKPMILFESGGGHDSTEWEEMASTLARETGSAVITYDRPGFGKSDLLETKEDLRQDTAALWR